MYGGAAAIEKNGANNLEYDDRDSRIPQPIPQPIRTVKKGPPGFGAECV